MVLCVVVCDVLHCELRFGLLQPDTRVIGPEHRQLQTDGMRIGRIHCSQTALCSSRLNRCSLQAAQLHNCPRSSRLNRCSLQESGIRKTLLGPMASKINTLPAKDGDLRLSASNACLPKTEISVFVTECVFFTSTCYKLHMFTLHDVQYS